MNINWGFLRILLIIPIDIQMMTTNACLPAGIDDAKVKWVIEWHYRDYFSVWRITCFLMIIFFFFWKKNLFFFLLFLTADILLMSCEKFYAKISQRWQMMWKIKEKTLKFIQQFSFLAKPMFLIFFEIVILLLFLLEITWHFSFFFLFLFVCVCVIFVYILY